MTAIGDREAFQNMYSFCLTHNEDQTDVLFFMLHQNLIGISDDRQHIHEPVWQRKSWKLTPNRASR